ncbi:ABC transporter permease [Defluviitalea phaphyphila]|uniref:ABC transporter permease n=1 Tax=Defluviitalea phaphyphila TaxID=1473580 RepID=UPI000731089F|nr:ABC transporter permease [Defluviitalea phaphyphila]
MKLLFDYIKKEIKFILNRKGVLFLLFVAPFALTVWFGGTYYHNYVNEIPIGVLDEDKSSLSRNIIQYFNDNERFNITHYATNREELKTLLDNGEIYGGIYIPPNLYKNINMQKEAKVVILIDESNIIIGNNIYAGAASIIQTISAGVGIKIIGAKGGLNLSDATNMALTFNFNDRLLYDPKMTYMNYLMIGFIAVFFQQMMLSAMATLLLRDGESVAQEHTFRRVIAKLIACCIFCITSCFISIFFIDNVYNVEIRGNVGIALLLFILFAFAITGPALIFCGIFKDKIKFSQFSYMLSLPTFVTCGYVWPIDQMPTLLANIVKVIWPLVNFARPLDEVLFKGVPFETIWINIIGLVIYSIFYIIVGVKFFSYRFTLQNDIKNVNINYKSNSNVVSN